MTARTSRKVNRPANPPKSNRAKAGNAAAVDHLKTLDSVSATKGRAILLHGLPDSGKTVCAILKAPRPLLVIDCDQGLDSVRGAIGSDTVDVWSPANTYEDLDKFRQYVKAGDWRKPYKVIVVDNLTAAQKPFIRHVIDESLERLEPEQRDLRDPDVPSQQNWGSVYRKFDQWIRDIRDVKERGVHVIFTAGTREWNDESAGFSRLMPDIEGRVRESLPTHMDAVAWLEADEDGRRMVLGPSGSFLTRVRLPVAQHNKIPDEIQDPDFNKMMAVVEIIDGKEAVSTTKRKTTTRRRTK